MIKIHSQSENNFRFSVQADTGLNLLNSVNFSNKTEMDKALRQLKTTNLTRNHFERKTNTEGQFLFLLRDDDGQPIGQSAAYDSEAGMENGIKNLRDSLKTIL